MNSKFAFVLSALIALAASPTFATDHKDDHHDAAHKSCKDLHCGEKGCEEAHDGKDAHCKGDEHHDKAKH